MTIPHINNRRLAVGGLILSAALLIPGLLAPVISIHGTLDPVGVADLAPKLFERGLSDETINTLRPMINPALLPLLELSPGGLKGALVSTLGGQIGQQLKTGPAVEVYAQTRSILGSIRHLYGVGSVVAATLILVFSVLVPIAKICLVMMALFHRDPVRRRRTLDFVAGIGKWSMADVFAVAIIIAYLAAQASQVQGGGVASGGVPPAIVVFDATFGAGFYWFAGYCLFSLAVQQGLAKGAARGGRGTA